ncbi:MAG TPA: thioredoxin domain-containing protein [Bryobacteraceae bacterium]|nr:thioredoxin domain-containing protein [Bryobacteraceae bacterium]
MKRGVFFAVLLVAGVTLGVGQQPAKPTFGRAMGNPMAPIRIDLYSDYQCPACKVFHQNTVGPLIDNYVKTGKVYLVHREFPLAMHAHAREAACYASAAEKLGKYVEVGDRLFRTQETWGQDGNVAAAACSALDANDAKKLRALAADPEIAAEVDRDIQAAQAENVSGTPTMIITKLVRRYPVPGPVSYAVLSKFLDSILN